MAEQLSTLHGFVSGKVQGVWFRAFTQQQALAANVSGWAKNLSDGRVEFMLSGAADDLLAVCKALHQGPEHARVDRVDVETLAYKELSGFQIR